MKRAITLFGATGFAGSHVAKELVRCAPEKMRLAIAGRNEDKLRALAKDLGRDVDIVVADAKDKDALAKMCGDSDVVLSTAGPFTRFGENLLAAAIDNHCHYADITGEVPWVSAMIDRYGTAAKENGVRCIPLCGFDSVPSDLGAYHCSKALREAGEDTAQIRGIFRIKGGMSGGTVKSALATFETGGQSGRFALCRDLPRLGNTGRGKDANLPYRVGAQTVAPFFMSPVNTRVVQRSAGLFAAAGAPYGERFHYTEHMSLGKSFSMAKSYAMTGGLALFVGLGSTRPGRRLLRAVLPAGSPSPGSVQEGYLRADFLGIGEKGGEVRVRIEAQGDPGNINTARFLVAGGLCLAAGDGRKDCGFLTPAYAFGDAMTKRLRDNGVAIKVM